MQDAKTTRRTSRAPSPLSLWFYLHPRLASILPTQRPPATQVLGAGPITELKESVWLALGSDTTTNPCILCLPVAPSTPSDPQHDIATPTSTLARRDLHKQPTLFDPQQRPGQVPGRHSNEGGTTPPFATAPLHPHTTSQLAPSRLARHTDQDPPSVIGHGFTDSRL